ncbi:MAG: hypothetical protein HY302_12945 [Opitutae bacterium]|nr:hypothetical protein [Opitutae bacterium]
MKNEGNTDLSHDRSPHDDCGNKFPAQGLKAMRLFFSTLLFAAAALLARADEPAELPVFAGAPPLLRGALLRLAADVDHWAYTQTTVSRNGKGAVKGETVVRYDPSQHYDVQWTPLKIDGKDPTPAQIKKYRSKRAKDLAKRRSLGELLDLRAATVAEETPTTVTYEVPLIKDEDLRLPPEKFRVTVRVNKEPPAFEQFALTVRESMRVAVVAKVKSGGAVLEFKTVDPKFAPALTTIRAGGTGSFLFVPVGGTYDLTRSDFTRVTPYDDRFKVKIGPLKTIDF